MILGAGGRELQGIFQTSFVMTCPRWLLVFRGVAGGWCNCGRTPSSAEHDSAPRLGFKQASCRPYPVTQQTNEPDALKTGGNLHSRKQEFPLE